MKRVRVKHFVYAGLDFIFDKNWNPCFLEANENADLTTHFKRLYKTDILFKKFANIVNRSGNNFCIATSRIKKKYDDDSNVFLNNIKKYLKDVESHIFIVENNRKRKKTLKTTDKKIIKPDAVFRWFYKFPKQFEKDGVRVINPNFVWHVTRNKMNTINAVTKAVNIRIPKTLLIRNQDQLKSNLRKYSFSNGYVIKPVCSTMGMGVVVMKNKNLVPIKGLKILEERIEPELLYNKKYWDARIFVVDGYFIGGLVRASSNMVTNVAQGAGVFKIPKKLLRKVEKPSLKIVKAIDDEAERIRLTGSYKIYI